MSEEQEYDELDTWTDPEDGCWYCGGRGYYVSCIDDLCHGSDECIHGDGYSNCPECNKDGKREWEG